MTNCIVYFAHDKSVRSQHGESKMSDVRLLDSNDVCFACVTAVVFVSEGCFHGVDVETGDKYLLWDIHTEGTSKELLN